MTAMPSDPLPASPAEAAEVYASALGWRLVPIIPGRKHPGVEAWQKAATDDLDTIRAWFGGLYRGHGVGVACGAGSDVWVLDVDDADAYRRLQEGIGALPRTVWSRSGSGRGFHLFYQWDPDRPITNGHSRNLPDGLDVRGEGGQVVIPPTIHPNGQPYTWGDDPFTTPIADAPDALYDLMYRAPDVTPSALRPKKSDPDLTSDRDSIAAWARTVYDFPTLLAEQGWTLVDTKGEDTYWARPGKAAREGHSGVLHGDGPFVHWTTSVPAPLRDPACATKDGTGWAFSLFGFLAATHHDGDRSQAARALRVERQRREGSTGKAGASTASSATAGDEADPDDPDDPPKPLLSFETLGETIARVDKMGDPGYLLEPIWPADAYGILGAESKAGKTWLACDLTVAVASGSRWFGSYPARQGPVVYFIGEGGPRNTARRMKAVAGFHGVEIAGIEDRIHLCFRAPQLTKADHLAEVAAKIHEIEPVLVIVDPLYLSAGGADSSSLFAMGEVFANIQAICEDAGAALVIVHHWNQTGSGKGKGRLSGAGGEEWGRVVASAAVIERKTEHMIGATRTVVDLEIEFVGGEIPDTKILIRRTVEAAHGLTSPMRYGVEMVSIDPQKARLDRLVEYVCQALEDVPDGLTGRQLAPLKPEAMAGQKVSRDEWRDAIAAAVDRGRITTEAGPQRSTIHRLKAVENLDFSARNGSDFEGVSRALKSEECAEGPAHSSPTLTSENASVRGVRGVPRALEGDQCASARGPKDPRTRTHPHTAPPQKPPLDGPQCPF